jgi:predicted GNAT family N-acyltransferase
MARMVRTRVFIEEQEVSFAEEFDHEDSSHHYLLVEYGAPKATGRWRITDKGIKLERFAVLASDRNRGLGAMVLYAILNDLKGRPEEIYLHAQITAVNFYLRHGFEKVGNRFVEADIVHYKMRLVRV